MTGIITGFFGLVGSTIKYTLGTGLVVGLAAIYMKPNDDSFPPYYSKWVKGQIVDATGGVPGASEAGALAARWFTTPQYNDFVVGKFVEVKIGGESLYFLGGFNGWYALQSRHGKIRIQ